MASGCDNVAWGGADIQFEAPPPVAGDTAVTAEEAPVTPPREESPILLAGELSGSRATLAVVGEVRDGRLGALSNPDSFPELASYLREMQSPGSEWILFAQGARVGRMRADSASIDRSYCTGRATVSGVVELVPEASGAERFIALPARFAEDRRYGPYRALSHNYDQRVASLNLAAIAIPRVGAHWPEGGVLESRADIQAFELTDASAPSIAATFLYQDRLDTSRPGPGAYALFLMASSTPSGYQESFVWYQDVDSEGKAAPRYFDHLDWNRDGQDEVLLDVFGAGRHWHAGLARQNGSWTRTFQDACAPPGTPTAP